MEASKIQLKNGFAPYPEYKDSGIEWIGKIPKEWDISPMRSLFSNKKELIGSKAENNKLLSLTLHGVIPRPAGDKGKHPENYETYQSFKRDDLVMCLFDYDVTPRTIGHVPEDGMLTGAYTRLIPKGKIYSRYYYYLYLALDQTKELLHLCTGLRSSISKPVFWSMKHPQPSIETQKKIAEYLDEKTELIDRIIERKKRLIELLREKRTAVINQAVTKGLDPNVELVDSGIEWIGMIPKGWEVKKLKYVSDMNRRTLSENTPGDYSFKYYDISSVNEENITSIEADTFFEKAPSRARRIVNSGDSIIATVRTYLKAVAFFDQVESNIIASTGFAVLSPKKALEPKYLYSYIQSDRFINEVIIRSKGISYPAINPSDLGSIEIVYPKIHEQVDIEKYLDEKVSGTNEILLKIEDSIRILKEFKSSLISNVVTGKIQI